MCINVEDFRGLKEGYSLLILMKTDHKYNLWGIYTGKKCYEQVFKNLNRIEFVVTMACTGRCKHCSEGEHISTEVHIDGKLGAQAVRELCGAYQIQSLMTFGGEPLLYPEEVCKIHEAAREFLRRYRFRQVTAMSFSGRKCQEVSW